ncbi:MAG: FapA family protein [Lachnospiraceae bacterium]|nr:FapA family protein [Lachnospiraceae bacterium]
MAEISNNTNKVDEVTQDTGANIVDKILEDISDIQEYIETSNNQKTIDEMFNNANDEMIVENVVKISEDQMSASIILADPGPDKVYTKKEIIETLKDNGVTYGISEAVIERILFEKRYLQKVDVAFGIMPHDGENAKYIYHFNTEPNSKPALLEDGSVDYHKLDAFESVKKGQLIAEYVPESYGKPGRMVNGFVVDPKHGRPLPAIRGKHIYKGEDGVTYYSDTDGKIEFNHENGLITISDIYVVSGDVDTTTGDIKFAGNVEVYGSVRSGYKIEAEGTVSVNGTVEAATIKAGKDVVIKGGMLGNGKGFIISGGNVEGRFFEQVNIVCEGYLKANSIINSYIDCNDEVEVSGSKGTIISGRVRALKGLKAANIGSDSNVHTYIKVGLDPRMNRTYKILSKQKQLLDDEMLKIAEAQRKLNELQGIPGLDEKRIAVTRLKVTKKSELDKVVAQLDEITAQIEAGRLAKVTVSKIAYRGCSVTINGITTHVNDDVKDVVFMLLDEKVVMTYDKH